MGGEWRSPEHKKGVKTMLVGCEINPLEEFKASFRGTFERSDVNAWMGKEGCGQVVSPGAE